MTNDGRRPFDRVTAALITGRQVLIGLNFTRIA